MSYCIVLCCVVFYCCMLSRSVFCCVVSCYVVSCRVVLCRNVLCCVVLCSAVSCCVLLYYVVSCPVVSCALCHVFCRTELCCFVLLCILSYCTVLCYVLLYCVVLCRVMLFYVVSCRVAQHADLVCLVSFISIFLSDNIPSVIRWPSIGFLNSGKLFYNFDNCDLQIFGSIDPEWCLIDVLTQTGCNMMCHKHDLYVAEIRYGKCSMKLLREHFSQPTPHNAFVFWLIVGES